MKVSGLTGIILSLAMLLFSIQPAHAGRLPDWVKPLPMEPELLAPEGFVFVKGGCFKMGDLWGDGYYDEKPVHKVCVDVFYMSKYEVTQREWEEVMGYNPSHFKGCDDCPVENVSWDDVQEFIERLREKTGINYRLPTEAEWEYAARSGGKHHKWAGTGDESELGEYAWYKGNSGERTHPVGQKKPNGLCLYDMSGNVWEWVQDWYDKEYYTHSPRDNPRGPSMGSHRVYLGGSWNFEPRFLRSSFRGYDTPSIRSYDVGFRLVVGSSSQE